MRLKFSCQQLLLYIIYILYIIVNIILQVDITVYDLLNKKLSTEETEDKMTYSRLIIKNENILHGLFGTCLSI